MNPNWTPAEDKAILEALDEELPFTKIRTFVPHSSDAALKKRITEIYAKERGVCPKCGTLKKLELGEVCCGAVKKKPLPVLKPKAKGWSEEEEHKLRAQVRAKLPLDEILKTTQRNTNSLRFRIARYVTEKSVRLTAQDAIEYKLGKLVQPEDLVKEEPEVEVVDVTPEVVKSEGWVKNSEVKVDEPAEVVDVTPVEKKKKKFRFWEEDEDASLIDQLQAGIHKYDIRIEGRNPPEISERLRVIDRAKAYIRKPRVERVALSSTLTDEKVFPGPCYSFPDIPPVYSAPLPAQLDATLHRSNTKCIKCEGELYTSAFCKACHVEFDTKWTQEVFDFWKYQVMEGHGILPDRGDDFIGHLPGLFQKIPGERFVDAFGGTGLACWAARTMGYLRIIYNDSDETTSALITQLKGGEKVRKDLFTLVNRIQHRHTFAPNSHDNVETKAAKRYLRIRGSGGIWAGDFTNPNAIQLYEHLEVHSENVYNFLSSVQEDKKEKTLFFINILRMPPGVFSQVATCVRKMDRCILLVPDSIQHVQTFNFLPYQYYLTHKGYLIFSKVELNPLAGMLEISRD